jgi:quercetin dioxygenase-like cupin family protein
MPTHTLALFQDDLMSARSLAAGDRIVYVVSGDVEITGDGRISLGENQAWHGAGACTIGTRDSARIWRWELHRGTAHPAGARFARAIDLPAAECLMRCDRVDFPLGGVAYTHTHQGPGIRVLLRGRFRVEVGGHEQRIAPGEPWFESGPDPVYAEASREELTSFVRVMVLPRALLGKSSIRYVKPEDQARPKTQTYTVFVDTAISG